MTTPEQFQRAAASLHRERFGDRTPDEVLASHERKEARMRALVTGSEGFLGRHFTAELLSRGYTVTGLDTKITKSLDCRTYFATRAGNAARYDLVVHCAAVVGGRETIEGNPLATAVNLALDAEMFAWAARAKPGRVLYISSSAAYPVWAQNGGREPRLSESMMNRTDPDEIYGWSKVMGEVLAGRLRAAGVPVTVVRPFSGYGSDQDLSYPFPAFIERARQKQDPFEVWCGSCVRDFIHVDDVVNGALAVAESGTELPVNLCTGVATSFRELAQLVIDARDKQLGRLVADTSHSWDQEDMTYVPDVAERADKPAGVAYRVGDPTRMRTFYEPKVTLEEGIRRALEA